MLFALKSGTEQLRAAKDPQSQSLGLVNRLDRFSKIAPDDGGWSNVQVRGDNSTGFLPADRLEQAPETPAPSPDVDLESFKAAILFACRTHGADPVHLLAVAKRESDVKNIKSKASNAFGPYQFMPDTWAELAAKNGAATGITKDDIGDPFKQVVFAAISSKTNMDALEQSLGRLPTGLELYLAHFLGLAGAGDLLGAAPTTSMRDILLPRHGEARTARILAANAALLADPQGNPLTADGVMQAVDRFLGASYAWAAREMGDAAVTVAAGGPVTGAAAGDPPWLLAGLRELARGVVEDESPGGTNKAIEAYFTATNHGPATDDVAWCAAFVAWCMANSGDPAVAAVNIASARAAHWSKWGSPAETLRRGSVAVTKPLSKDSSGHVGFVVAVDQDKVHLLAGNQRDPQRRSCVCIVRYPLNLFVAFRDLK